MNDDIMEIVKKFASQGHSGFSAQYALNLVTRLLQYKPITPLTGEDEEWVELDYGDDLAYQNKRCPQIFKQKDGKIYDVEGKVFSSDNGKIYRPVGYDETTNSEGNLHYGKLGYLELANTVFYLTVKHISENLEKYAL